MSDYKPIHTPTYTQADLDRVRQEARTAAFRECAQIATMMAAGETYETGRQKALNIAAALEAAANSAPKDTEP